MDCAPAAVFASGLLRRRVPPPVVLLKSTVIFLYSIVVTIDPIQVDKSPGPYYSKRTLDMAIIKRDFYK